MSSPSLEEVVTGLEEQTWKALSEEGSKLLPFLSDDCIMLFPLGLKVSNTSKPSLEDILLSESFVPWLRYEMRDVEVSELGRDGALITYAVTAFRPPLEGDDEVEFRALCATAWKLDEDKQRLVLCFHQQTPYQL